MLRLKLDKLLYEKRLNANQLSKMTGIRYPTVYEMARNEARHWVPENLNKIMAALGLKSIDELIEYVPDEVNE